MPYVRSVIRIPSGTEERYQLPLRYNPKELQCIKLNTFSESAPSGNLVPIKEYEKHRCGNQDEKYICKHYKY